MAYIKGEIRTSAPNREDIEAGYKLLNQAAFSLEHRVINDIFRAHKL
jgi:hypothetical protein